MNIVPGSWLGLLGGGQLGRMFTMAAQSMGYHVCVLDPSDHSPAGSVADRHIRADYVDARALDALATLCKGVTTEFENVPAQALGYLASRSRVTPSAEAVAVTQDRLAEKAFVRQCGLDPAPYAELRSPGDIASAPDELFPGIVKIARMGYDGKGQFRVADRAEARQAFESVGAAPCVLEKQLALELEISVIVARRGPGDAVFYPISENTHANGILDTSIAPARIAEPLAERARAAALRIADRLDYIGVLCVEFFVLEGGLLRVNEIAPRPHNSGHYTIDACVVSQFEQQARILADMPLGSTRQLVPAVMLNLLGEVWSGGEPDWAALLGRPGVALHLYGKRETRRGRKMGHVTCVAASLGEALATADAIHRQLQGGR